MVQAVETLIAQPVLPAQVSKNVPEARAREATGSKAGSSSVRDGSTNESGLKEEDFDTILQNKCPTVPLHLTPLCKDPNPLARHGLQLKDVFRSHQTKVSSIVRSL